MGSSKSNSAVSAKPPRISTRQWMALAALLVAGLFTKVVRLDFPQKHYFDEVYHGFTAEVLYNNDPRAYDPWAKPPQGMAYEWTHPPLGKLLITATMKLAGSTSWVPMRLSSAVFGTALIAVAFFIGLEAFGSATAGLFAVFLLTVEGLVFTQSRIAMIDTHLLFFCLAAVYFYIRYRARTSSFKDLAASSLFISLGLATKWSAVYFLAALGVDSVISWWWSRDQKNALPLSHLVARVLGFTLVPGAVYLLSYIHYFSLGFTWPQFEELQRQMWWYHTNLKATHGYQSTPLQWIFNLRPVWFYVDYTPDGKVSNIYNLGNSLVLIPGLAICCYWLWKTWNAFTTRKPLSWSVSFLIALYFLNWVPWVASPRIMFFYHYMPSVSFLALLLAGWLARVWEQSPQHRLKIGGYLAVCLLWFVVFLPNAIGLPVDKAFAEGLYGLIHTWK